MHVLLRTTAIDVAIPTVIAGLRLERKSDPPPKTISLLVCGRLRRRLSPPRVPLRRHDLGAH